MSKFEKNFSCSEWITHRPNGRKRAFHVKAFHNGVDKWDYATTRSPATVRKMILEVALMKKHLWYKSIWKCQQLQCQAPGLIHLILS